jgi:beta-aspartyl-peptidase (threonine type)
MGLLLVLTCAASCSVLNFPQNAVRATRLEHAGDGFERARSEIEKALNNQAKAWNDGDLPAFMSAYCRRADTSYVSADAQIYGYDAIEARYKKRYGDNRESMGLLTFSDLKFVDVSPTSVICIGRFQVEKKDKKKAAGVFSLVLIKEENGWKILHDHTSAAPDSSS